MDHSTTRRPPSHRARGLVLKNPGGQLGWLLRHCCPGAATRFYLAWIRLTRAGAIRRFIAEFAAAPAAPWFNHVEIETINRCNGECEFCPVNRRNETRPFAKMPEKLYAGIIAQLSEIGYSGSIALFSNNEPLLDDRLEGFAAAARSALPKAHLNLSTNGRLLDVDRLRRLLPLFDRIVINNYHVRPVLHDNIRKVHEFCMGREGERLLEGKTVEICLRCQRDVLTTRAGTAPNCPTPTQPLRIPCHLPFSQLIVRADGKVSLCCNDALGRMTLGDLSAQSVEEVWRGEECGRVRERMLASGRAGLSLCRECDFVKHDV